MNFCERKRGFSGSREKTKREGKKREREGE